jgi:hypothetical protein
MTGRNANIYFQEKVYNKLRQLVGEKISRFVNEAVEEKLQKSEQKNQEEFQQKLIAGYKRIAKNQKIQEELGV